MTREEAIKEFESQLKWAELNTYPYVSNQKIEANEMAIKALEQEPTTKNDLGVENDLVSSIVEKISEKATETREEFIFETIRPYCENVVQIKVSKRDLEQALLKYYGKNDLGTDCIKKSDAINIIQDMHGLARADVISDAVNRIIATPSVTPQEPRKGHWIPTYGNVECSVCGRVKDSREVGKATHYCDFCGAKMESER